MWGALCDLSRSVVEDAVKAAGGGKRSNISSVSLKKAAGDLKNEVVDQGP